MFRRIAVFLFQFAAMPRDIVPAYAVAVIVFQFVEKWLGPAPPQAPKQRWNWPQSLSRSIFKTRS